MSGERDGGQAGGQAGSPAAQPGKQASSAGQRMAPKGDRAPEAPGADLNSMRAGGDSAARRRAIPPLEDRFNVIRVGLVARAYHFREPAGKIAFTDKLLSISTPDEHPAAIKAMIDRAAERGWGTVSLKGSPEFMRQGWIAATAQGLKALGHAPTAGDREASTIERTRQEAARGGATDPPRQINPVNRVSSTQVERVHDGPSAAAGIAHRQLAAAIETALGSGKVSPEIRDQLRNMLVAEGARRIAGGEKFKVPVYDARAPRTREKTIHAGPQRAGNRERSR